MFLSTLFSVYFGWLHKNIKLYSSIYLAEVYIRIGSHVAIFAYWILIADPSRGTPSDVIYTSLKSTLSAWATLLWLAGHLDWWYVTMWAADSNVRTALQATAKQDYVQICHNRRSLHNPIETLLGQLQLLLPYSELLYTYIILHYYWWVAVQNVCV